MSGNNKHFFDDVKELRDEASFGALGGEGARELGKTRTELTAEGIATTCACTECARPNIITVSFEEAIIGSLRLLPQNWKAENNGMYDAMVGCANCRYLIKLVFTPEELNRWVVQAVGQGLLPAAQADQIRNRYVNLARGATGAGQGRR